jgi:hypothetical protein
VNKLSILNFNLFDKCCLEAGEVEVEVEDVVDFSDVGSEI